MDRSQLGGDVLGGAGAPELLAGGGAGDREKRRQGDAEAPRILVVDDSPAIQDVFRQILALAPVPDDLDVELEPGFDRASDASTSARYAIDFASQGREGLACVKNALDCARPYRVAFVDVRMPPGLDGVQTAALMRECDPCLQIVICTAYSDYAWPEIVRLMGGTDSFLILKKPFDVNEVRQLACSLSAKWSLQREAQTKLDRLEDAVRARTADLRQANEKLQEEMDRRVLAERDLMRSQRLQALGRLVAGIGHEINNPLSYVMANVGYVRDVVLAGPERSPATASDDVVQALDAALYGATRIQSIVKEIRCFARNASRADTDLDVRDVIRSSLAMVEHEVSHRGRLLEDLRPAPLVRADPQELGQVVTNLLVNASQALSETHVATNYVRAACFEGPDGCAVLRVEDNGKGIAKAELDKVFDPFFTTREVGGGMGLGLSICHEIVTRLGGHISLNSTPGEGTQVTVTLPASDARAATTAVPSQKRAPTSVRILAVDDDPLVLQSLVRMLKGYQTHAVASAEEAVRAYTAKEYDVVLCDLMMPTMSGMDLYDELLRRGREHADKLLFLTGGAFTARAEEFLASHPVVCLHKPVSRGEVLHAIAEMLPASAFAESTSP